MILKSTHVKLIDFNLSEWHEARASGTSAFHPPETIVRFSMKPISEMWAVGCTLLELVVGANPFEMSSRIARTKQIADHLALIEMFSEERVPSELVAGMDPKIRNMTFINGRLSRNTDVRTETLEVSL
jgi:serine/threonine protein kinase